MNEIPEHIKNSVRMLTDEEKALLEEYAEGTGAPKVIWQVYDDSNIEDEDFLGTEKAGLPHLTQEDAVTWANEQGLKAFSVYQETRCCTRKGKIWYNQAASYSYSSW